MAREVNIQIEFVRVGEIDNLNEKFHGEVRIDSSWIERSHANIDYYDPEIHWNPKLYVKNLISDAKEKLKYEIQVLGDGVYRITEIKSIKGQFWERMELYDVPFDMQELNIIVTSSRSPSEIKLLANTSDYYLINQETRRTFVDQQKWKLFSIYKLDNKLDRAQTEDRVFNPFKFFSSDVEKGARPNQKKQKPKIVATCYVARHPGYFMFNAFFLIFLITASALTVFAIPQNAPQGRLQTTYTIMLSSVSFKWVFNRSLPSVSYLTLLDKYSICGILYINLLAAWHSLVGTYSKQWDPLVDQWLLVSFASLFAVGHICFFLAYLSITKRKRELLYIERDILAKVTPEDADEY